MKFGQLIDSDMRNIFPEKSYTKCDGETSRRLKSTLSMSLDLKFYTICLYCMPS